MLCGNLPHSNKSQHCVVKQWHILCTKNKIREPRPMQSNGARAPQYSTQQPSTNSGMEVWMGKVRVKANTTVHDNTCVLVLVCTCFQFYFSGFVCIQWVVITDFRMATLSLIPRMSRLMLLNLAWTDSPPCSPWNPRPTFQHEIHGMTCSSSRCIFGVTLSLGKLHQKNCRYSWMRPSEDLSEMNLGV